MQAPLSYTKSRVDYIPHIKRESTRKGLSILSTQNAKTGKACKVLQCPNGFSDFQLAAVRKVIDLARQLAPKSCLLEQVHYEVWIKRSELVGHPGINGYSHDNLPDGLKKLLNGAEKLIICNQIDIKNQILQYKPELNWKTHEEISVIYRSLNPEQQEFFLIVVLGMCQYFFPELESDDGIEPSQIKEVKETLKKLSDLEEFSLDELTIENLAKRSSLIPHHALLAAQECFTHDEMKENVNSEGEKISQSMHLSAIVKGLNDVKDTVNCLVIQGLKVPVSEYQFWIREELLIGSSGNGAYSLANVPRSCRGSASRAREIIVCNIEYVQKRILQNSPQLSGYSDQRIEEAIRTHTEMQKIFYRTVLSGLKKAVNANVEVRALDLVDIFSQLARLDPSIEWDLKTKRVKNLGRIITSFALSVTQEYADIAHGLFPEAFKQPSLRKWIKPMLKDLEVAEYVDIDEARNSK